MNNLHSIHKIPLDLVEDHNSQRKQPPHEDEAIQEPAPANEFAGAQEAVFEGLQDGGDGVQAHQFVHWEAQEMHALGLAEWIHDRGGVHPQGHQKGEKDLQVAVLGGEGRYDGAEAEGQTRNHRQQQREQQYIPVEVCLAGGVGKEVDKVDKEEKAELYAEAQQVADYIGDGHHQAREIHLAEDA